MLLLLILLFLFGRYIHRVSTLSCYYNRVQPSLHHTTLRHLQWTHTHSHRFILSVNKRSDKETRVTNRNAANLYCVCVIALMATANIQWVCVCDVFYFYFYLLFFKVIVLFKFYSMNGNSKCVSDDGVLLHVFFCIVLSWTDSLILNSWRQCNTIKVWNVISAF